MRALLNRGRIIVPESIADARRRLELLDREIARIEGQLADPERRKRIGLQGWYDGWRKSATNALTLFRLEREQLRAWVDVATCDLLKLAYDTLKSVQEDEGDEFFDETELALIDRLDKHFAS